MSRASTTLLVALAAGFNCPAAPIATLEVFTGDHDRRDTPVSISLPQLGLGRIASVELQDVLETRPMEAQVENGNALCWILKGHTPAGRKRTFVLSTIDNTNLTTVSVRQDTSTATVLLDDKPVLSYQHALLPPPAGTSTRFERNGFIHPLWSPSGTVLTRIHPPDHTHHFGLWGPWTKTEFEGEPIDFWNLNQGQGTVRFARFAGLFSGPVFGGFDALQEHVWLKAPEGARVVLNELLSVRVWNSAGQESWVTDYTCTYRCATASPLLLEAYRYGGLGFRGLAAWHNGNSDYLTSDGNTRRDGDGTRARWCDVYGETDRGIEGLLFMSHPQNQAHPEPMRIWPANSNGGRGDVFFNFCPTRDADWELTPGRNHMLRYRLYCHSGKLTATEAERLWQDFADPPQVRLIKRQTRETNQLEP